MDIDDGETHFKHSSEIAATINVGPFELGASETRGHLLYKSDCDCTIFTDPLTKSSCRQNKTTKNSGSSLTVSVSMGVYIGIGLDASLGVNLTELCNRIVEIFK